MRRFAEKDQVPLIYWFDLNSFLGPLVDHKSLIQNRKLYIYGGSKDLGDSNWNQGIFVLNLGILFIHFFAKMLDSLQWETSVQCPRVHGSAQIYGDYMYLFGGNEKNQHDYLSVLDLSKILWDIEI